MSKFEIHEKKSEAGITLEISGAIDEDALFIPDDYIQHPSITVDFSGVTAINSCGIREWMRLLADIPAKIPIVYRNCPKVIVDQMNFIEGFVRKGITVESFQIPYYCESCDELTVMTVQRKTDYPDGQLSLSDGMACRICGKPAELDILEDKYLKFMKSGG